MGEEIKGQAKTQLTLVRPDIREVGDLALVRRCGVELPIEQVRRDVMLRPKADIFLQPASLAAGLQAGRKHLILAAGRRGDRAA